jgi:hypothetical protein
MVNQTLHWTGLTIMATMINIIVAGPQKAYKHITEEKKMKSKNKPTAFNNEITGIYHRTPKWLDRLYMLAGVLLIIALPFIIADLIWGAEVVTEWVANLV